MEHPKFKKDDEGNLLLNFGQYGGEVEVAAISADGTRVLTVQEVGFARVWDAATNHVLAEIRPDSPLAGSNEAAPGADPFKVFIESAALDRKGNHALLGLNDGSAVIYRVDDANCLAVLHPPGTEIATDWDVIRAVAFSRKSDLALVGFPGRRIGVWSTDGSRRVAFLDAPEGDRLVGRPFVRDTLCSSVSMSPDEDTVFAGAVDTTAVIFGLAGGDVLMRATEHAEEVLALFDRVEGVGWATTGGTLYVSTDDGVKKVLETSEHWAEVAFDADRLIARAFDGSITQWTFSGDRTILFEPSEPQDGMWADNATTLWLEGSLALYPENRQRLVLRRGEQCTVIERDAQLVRAKLSACGATLATDGGKNEVELWDARTGAHLRSVPCPGGNGCFAFSPDGRLIATGEIGHGGGSFPRQVAVYEIMTGKCRLTLRAHDWQVRQLEFSPDGRLLASVGDELVVWDLEEVGWFKKRPMLRAPLDRVTGSVAFWGSSLIAADEGRVRIWVGDQLQRTFDAPIGFGTQWVLARSGDAHMSVAADQRVFRFDLTTGTLERQLDADIPRPDRLPPLTVASEHGIRGGAMLWRTKHGRFLHQSDGPRGWVEPLALSRRGLVAVPATSGAAILRVTDQTIDFVGSVPFEGKMRAGRVVDEHVVLVNEAGRVFRAGVPQGE